MLLVEMGVFAAEPEVMGNEDKNELLKIINSLMLNVIQDEDGFGVSEYSSEYADTAYFQSSGYINLD